MNWEQEAIQKVATGNIQTQMNRWRNCEDKDILKSTT